MAEPNFHRGMRRRRSGGLGRGLVAAALAVVAHGLFGAFLVFLSLFQWVHPPAPKRARKQEVALRPMTQAEWAKNRGQPPPPDTSQRREPEQKRAEKKPEERKKDEKPKGQVVDTAPGNDRESDDAKYLSESSNQVERESRARETSAFYKNAMPQRTQSKPSESDGADPTDKLQLAGNDGRGTDDRPVREKPAESTLQIPKVERQDKVALKTESAQGPGAQVQNRDEVQPIAGNSNRLELPSTQTPPEGEAESVGKLGSPDSKTLIPSMAVLDKISGAAPNDRIDEDVPEGDGTFLNTKEWKHAGFFNRVKQSVGQHWNPSRVLHERDPTGQIYGGRDRYTLVQVTLNTAGRVTEVYVEKSSGLEFLDLEAIRSFERAQPFPNPPPGMMDADERVRFSFGFFLEMGGRPGMRIFRRAN